MDNLVNPQSMNLLITICARGGSKGIPKKNVQPVNSIPLIEYTIRHARRYAEEVGGDIALSTDDGEIRAVALQAGLSTNYTRPAVLATDTVGKVDVIQDLLRHTEEEAGKEYDYVLDLDVTSPLRTMEDLRKGFHSLQEHREAHNLFSVSPSRHNPYFDVVEKDKNEFVRLVKIPQHPMTARQEGPKTYDLNASFYFYRRSFFRDSPPKMFGSALAYIMPHMCFEIDERLDLEILEHLVKERKLDFDFQ
jgi:CMP-N,N'-diacetyllegionaminic acid synthase